jgi:predicted nucleic acid-binding protein
VSYLLDTNVVSEIRKPRRDQNVHNWFTLVPDNSTYLSALVIGEIRMGIEQVRRRDPHQASILDRWTVDLRARFADRVLPVTAEIAEEWARMNVPDPVPIIDGFIAATAKVHDLTFVTRDTGQFEQRGVRVLNPFIPLETP